MHELLHVPWLVGKDIGDGYDRAAETGHGGVGVEPATYGYNMVVNNAQSRNLPGREDWLMPENVADNYVYFAYAVRGSQTDCSWSTYAGNLFGLNGFLGNAILFWSRLSKE